MIQKTDQSYLGSILLWGKGIPNLGKFLMPEEVVFDVDVYVSALWYEPILVKILGRDFIELTRFKKDRSNVDVLERWMREDISSSLLFIKKGIDKIITLDDKPHPRFILAGENQDDVEDEIDVINYELKKIVNSPEVYGNEYVELLDLGVSTIRGIKTEEDYLDDGYIAQAVRLRRGI